MRKCSSSIFKPYTSQQSCLQRGNGAWHRALPLIDEGNEIHNVPASWSFDPIQMVNIPASLLFRAMQMVNVPASMTFTQCK